MNILVIGGNGYLGSKTVHALHGQGHTLICTRRERSDLTRLADLNDRISWIPADIGSVRKAASETEIGFVLNLACNYGGKNVRDAEVLSANFEFPYQILDCLSEMGVKHFLTIGTGLPDRLNMYSFSKYLFGESGSFFCEKRGIHFYNVLLEMMYGADEPPNRFLPSVTGGMLKGEEIRTTEGTQRRDIIAAADVVKALLMIMESGLEGYQEIPVGTGEAPEISEVIDFIWEETGRKSAVHKGAVPMRPGEPSCRADTSVLRSIGDWSPVPWRAGIRNMIQEMSKNMKE